MTQKIMLLLLLTITHLSLNGAAMPKKQNFPKSIQPGGDLARRIELTVRRLQSHPFDIDLIMQDVARIPEKKRRFEEYEGDISGRVLGAWSYLARLRGERPTKLDSIAEKILTYQNPDGYFGQNQQSIGWDFWGRQNFGHGRLLVGLIQNYWRTHDPRYLISAEKLGDYFVNTIPKWTTGHPNNPYTKTGALNWQNGIEVRQHFVKTHQTSVLEGLMMLYEASGQKRYLKAGEKVAELIPEYRQYHSHSFLNSLVGLAMLYRHTGESRYFDRLLKEYWQNILPHSRQPDGAVCEFYPADQRTEGCSIVDWIRLNLQLWQLTGKPVYLDEAEKSWLNGLNFHQTANGAFGHAVLSPAGYEAPYSEAWWCCLMHGLYAYTEILNYSLVSEADKLWINFFFPFESEIRLQNNIVKVQMKTSYPENGDIRLSLKMDKLVQATIFLRLPHWLNKWEILINDVAQNVQLVAGYLPITRLWRSDDVINFKFNMSLRIEDQQGNNLLTQRHLGDYFHPGYFFHGPLLLGADLKWNHKFPERILFDSKADYHEKTDVQSDSNPFSIPAAHYKIPAIYQNELNSVTLVPISEQTGYDVWTDEWRKFIRNGEEPIERVPVQMKQRVNIK